MPRRHRPPCFEHRQHDLANASVSSVPLWLIQLPPFSVARLRHDFAPILRSMSTPTQGTHCQLSRDPAP